MSGAVDADHPLHDWLVANRGSTPADCASSPTAAQRPDLIGVNYYPTLSGRELTRRDGEIIEIAERTWTTGLSTVLTEYHRRYGLPVFLSETALDGTPAEHIDWLHASVDEVAQLRADGVPVIGFTWWPLFDFVDWSWASGGQVVEEFYVRDDPGAVPHPVRPRR